MKDTKKPSAPYLVALELADEANPNLAEAFESLREAASAGDIRAEYAIATWYLHGREGVVERDVLLAFEMLKGLEDSCIPEAIFDLAIFYDFGEFVERDEERAFSLYMQAALLGNKEACEQIAEFFREGSVVEHDEKLQRAWLRRAEQKEAEISPPYRVWLRPQS